MNRTPTPSGVHLLSKQRQAQPNLSSVAERTGIEPEPAEPVDLFSKQSCTQYRLRSKLRSYLPLDKSKITPRGRQQSIELDVDARLLAEHLVPQRE